MRMCMCFVTTTLPMLLCMHQYHMHAHVNMWRLHSHKWTVMTHLVIRQVDSVDAGQVLRTYKSPYKSQTTTKLTNIK